MPVGAVLSPEIEMIREAGILKRPKIIGPNGLPPSFKGNREMLTSKSTKLLQSTKSREEILRDWCDSVNVSIYKSFRSSCAPEKRIREKQAGLRPGRCCIHHIFAAINL